MINYFAILRLNFLRDNQTLSENLGNSFKIHTSGTFRKKKNFENRESTRDSSALWAGPLFVA